MGAISLAVSPAPVLEQILEEREYLGFVGLVVRGGFAFHRVERSFLVVAVGDCALAIPTAELRPVILDVACLG
jgi:hypothetical protein